MIVWVFVVSLGLCFGSFLNVVIYRLAREQSLVRPASRCPTCGVAIAVCDNIPVLSWLLLQGHCRACRAAISLRYPIVELFTGLLSIALWWRWPGRPLWAISAILACGGWLAAGLIDWDTMLIPDELSLGVMALGLLAAPWNPYFGTEHWYGSLFYAVCGAVFGFALCWGVAALGEKIFGKEAMGGGDIKLLAGVGAWSGVLGSFDCLIVASFLGAVYGLAMIMRGKLSRSQPIAFGPFLSAAAVFNFFVLLPFGFPF